MAAQWQQLVDAGAYFSFNLWWQLTANPNTFYNFAPGGLPGTPWLTAKNANGDTLMSLSTIPDANGSWVQIASVPFTNSSGVTIPAYQYLYCYLSQASTALYAGMALYFQVDFTPPNQPMGIGDIRIIASSSQLVFTRDLRQLCGTGAGSVDDESQFLNRLLEAGYSIPIEDDWRGSTTPPATPLLGLKWIVPLGATGAWAGHDGQVATWGAAGWIFELYPAGTTAYIRARNQRAQLVDFNHTAGVLSVQVGTSSANCVAWVPDHILDQLEGPYLGIVGAVLSGPPLLPNCWDQAIIGGAGPYTWPNYSVSLLDAMAVSMVDQSTNSYQWVYRLPPQDTVQVSGDFAMHHPSGKFIYYNGLGGLQAVAGTINWHPLGNNIDYSEITGTPGGGGGASTLIALTDVNAVDGPASDGKSLSFDNATDKWIAQNPKLRNLLDVTMTPGGGYDQYSVVYYSATDDFRLKNVAGGGGGGGATHLYDLVDVSITEGAGITGYILAFNGTQWVAENILPVAHGGTGANLSGTGGAHEVVMQTTVGGNFSVAQLSPGDLGGGGYGNGQSPVWNGTAFVAGSPAVAFVGAGWNYASAAQAFNVGWGGTPKWASPAGVNYMHVDVRVNAINSTGAAAYYVTVTRKNSAGTSYTGNTNVLHGQGFADASGQVYVNISGIMQVVSGDYLAITTTTATWTTNAIDVQVMAVG